MHLVRQRADQVRRDEQERRGGGQTKTWLEGKARAWSPDGSPSKELYYRNGKLHGRIVEYHPGGRPVPTEWADGRIVFFPTSHSKRSLYFKMVQSCSMSDQGETNLVFRSVPDFIKLFGQPDLGSTSFNGFDGTVPRTWSYQCSDGVLPVRVLLVKGDFHVLVDPDDTLR